MNTTLPLSVVHSPGTEDRQVFQIPAPDELRELAFSDRLSFRIGLWLMERAQRPHGRRARRISDPLLLSDHTLSPRESMALLTFDLHRQMR